MPRKSVCMLLGVWVFLGQLHGQQVFVDHEEDAGAVAPKQSAVQKQNSGQSALTKPKTAPLSDVVAKTQTAKAAVATAAPTQTGAKSRPVIAKPVSPEELKPQATP